MACHHPKPAYLSTEGKVTFVRREKALGSTGFIHVRCGMCLGCKADHARDWAIRCYHEAAMHEDSCFVTFTYDPAHLPPSGTLNKHDLQLFFKRFRKQGHKIRYFAAGEYGTKKGRPHYHAILFGYRGIPTELARVSDKGHPQWRDRNITKAWHYGEATWGAFHETAASYVASYTADKLKSFAKDEPDPETGLRPYEVMGRDGVIYNLQPEFQLQSLKPAIGLRWLEKYWRDVFPADSVVMNGREYPPPRFYYKWLKENHSDVYQIVQGERKKQSASMPYETGETQYFKAQAKHAKLSQKMKRPLHEAKK